MKKILALALSVMVMMGAVSVSTLAAENVPPKDAPGREIEDVRGRSKLDLSDEQQQQMAEIRRSFEKETIDLRYDFQQKQRELRSLWRADTLNEAAINSKTREVNALKIQLITKSRAMREQLKAILTPEQQEQLEEGFKRPGPGGSGLRGMRCPF